MYLYCCATIIKEEISSFYFHKWRGSHKYSPLNLGKVLGGIKKGKMFLSLTELTQPWRTGNQLSENILSAFYRGCLMGCKKQTSPVDSMSTPAPLHCRLPSTALPLDLEAPLRTLTAPEDTLQRSPRPNIGQCCGPLGPGPERRAEINKNRQQPKTPFSIQVGRTALISPSHCKS